MKQELVSREFWYRDRKHLMVVMTMLSKFMDIAEDYSSLMESLEGDEQSWLDRQAIVREMINKADYYLDRVKGDTFFEQCDRCGKSLDQLLGEDIYLEEKSEVVCENCFNPLLDDNEEDEEDE